MHKKLVGIIVLIIFLESMLIPISLSSDEVSWWNSSWSYRTEILIPINTSLNETKSQPIDINLHFDKPCWAKNENEHSIRVVFQDTNRFIELESQIYELNHTDNEHISSCNLVFLIPEEANGNEKYFVYYDGEKKSSPNYINHVDIDESYYQYEPIQGFKFESNYYKITEDDYIVYAVNKKGFYLGESASQQITKLKKGSKEIKPSNGEQLVSPIFAYYWLVDGKWNYISSAQELVSSQIIADGNLMVYFYIISKSTDGLLKSTVFYKYYFCPTENKRIQIHVKHEIVNYPLPKGEDIDLAFMIIPFARFKSNSIKELNFGEIPKYLHFYSEKDYVLTYEIDQYPESKNWQEMIGKKDDYDLGNNSWVSFDNGETGITHSIIFEKNNIVKSGADERDGIELQLYESHNVQLPGLDAYIAYLYVMRNAYEKNEPLDLVLPQDYVAEFNAEFFTAETGGYKAIEKEADLFKKLISYKPVFEKDLVEDGKEKKEFELKTYVHLPLNLLSKLWGIKAIIKKTYISAELFDDKNNLIAHGIVGRISINEQMRVDWKNISFFRKIVFPHIPSGKYIVKIWLENTLFGDNREFIGYDIVDLQKNTTIHIFCKPEGKIRITVLDQEKNGIENTQVSLIKDGFEVIKNISDSSGKLFIEAPCGLKERYQLNVTYNGFLINSQDVRLGGIRRFLPIIKKFIFPVYDLAIGFKDSKKEKPDFNVNLSLTSIEMQNPVFLYPNIESNNVFYFKKLYPANYTLLIRYNQFEIKKFIKIPDVESISIDLYDYTLFLKDNWNFTFYTELDITLTSDDFEKVVVLSAEKLSSGGYIFRNLYFGNYTLKISYLEHTMVVPVFVSDGKNVETIVFPAEYNTSINVFDARGNYLKDAKVLIKRTENNQEKQLQGFTNEEGFTVFSLPPSFYDCEIYVNEELVAKRKIDVLNEKNFDVVTKSEPIFLNVLIVIFVILIFISLFISFKKKDIGFFLKFFVIGITIIAIFSPWWSLNGVSNQSETKTNLFLMPTKMVTVSSNENVTAGVVSQLDENFTFVIGFLPFFFVFGLMCVVLSMLLNKYNKKRFSLIVFIIALIIFVSATMVFYYAMSEFANSTVGSFYGDGDLEINIPGEKTYVIMYCSWGPSAGFYLLVVSVIVLFISLLFYFNTKIFFYKKNYKL